MKLPQLPPAQLPDSNKRVDADWYQLCLEAARHFEENGRYLHWDEFRYKPIDKSFTHEELWWGIKLYRKSSSKPIGLVDHKQKPFTYSVPDPVARQLHEIDLGAGGQVGMMEPITNVHTQHQYLVRSLVQEAITSSQLEGAATPREVAKEMIRSSRKPRDKSERMILNNYRTMKALCELKDKDLSPDLVFKIHRMVTNGTLDKPDGAGRFRTEAEKITLQNSEGDVFYEPPAAEELPHRLELMCSFANGKAPAHFVHPALRAIILHFWLAYDHPFIDGNGRTARALFYWSMLKSGYWLFEYLSISEILLKAPIKYARSFLYTETDDNDLTYFIAYQAEVIRKAISNLHDYIVERTKELESTQVYLKRSMAINHRQQAVVSHAIRHPGAQYTVDGHKEYHSVAYDTARKDLLGLSEMDLLEVRKAGRAFLFISPYDIGERLRKLKNK